MQADWNVFFGGNYGRTKAKSEAGRELRLDREFRWKDLTWRIPAVYVCRQGIVVDFIMEVPESEFRAFLERWGFNEDGECHRILSRVEEQQLEQENPLSFDFRTELTLNGAVMQSAGGCGTASVPGGAIETEARTWLDHYGLDRTKVWRFWRQSYAWATKSRKSCPKRLRQMELHLEAEPVEMMLKTFRTPAAGESVTLHIPDTGDCQLTVRETSDEKVPIPYNDGWEFPDHVCRMSYTLTPDLSERVLRLYDAGEGDRPHPRRRPLPPIDPDRSAWLNRTEVQGDNAIAIIGGADGPTAVFWSVRQPDDAEKRVHTVCSTSHFEPLRPEEVTWQAVSCKKPCEDGQVSLI